MVLGLILAAFYILSDFYYWIKYAAAYCALRIRQITHHRRFDLYDFEADNQAEKLGVVVPEEERTLETPFSEEHLNEAADEIFLYGVNSKSECLVVRIARACNEEAEAWIYLKLSDGRRYQLQKFSGYQRSYGDECQIFSCGGLQMYYLSPMRKWRIVFCGMLREEKQDGKSQEQEVFVKFAFVWTASSSVYDGTSDFNIKTTADAMAKEKWTIPYPPIDKMVESLNFYSQSGVINGIVSVEGQPDKEMYLFGERIRYLGKSSSPVGCKFKHVIGVTPQNGLVFHLGNASVPNTYHNLNFGFIVHPNGTLYTVEDGLIISKLSETSPEVNNLTAMFKAEKQYELKGNIIGDGIVFKSEEGWSGHLELREIICEIGPCRGSGLLLLGEVTNTPARKILKVPPMYPKHKPLIVSFTDPISHLTKVSGGKGSSLGRLTELSNKLKSFVVPKGIIVTTSAYSEFLTAEIIDKIETLKDTAYGNIKGNTEEACKIVSVAIERAYLPNKLKAEIEKKLNELFDGNVHHCKFAVRSSATGEDTDQMSAAGQMDTFLGVQGLEEVFNAVKKCWASQFGYVAVEYKRQNGQILNSPMAVVIQEMVECEAAGVLFTCDPVTNNPSVIVLTGNYGLGESVVSGSEEPDTIVLKRFANNTVELKSVTVGLKERKIVVADTKTSDGKETVVEDVPEEKRKECCISNEIAEQLGKLSLKIEDYYKSPRDIEWGIRNNTIYILQSRPVTTGVAASDYEIIHDIDGPLRCESDYNTVCNVAEVLPGAVSPLGLDVIIKYPTMVFQRKKMASRQRNNFQKATYFASGLAPFYNHQMMSVVDLIGRLGDCDSILGQCMMIAVFGRILDDPGMKTLAGYKEWKPMKKSLTNTFTFFWNLFFSQYGIESLKEKIFRYEIPVEKCRTSLETFETIMKNCSHHIQPFEKHMICSEKSAIWNMHMFALLGEAKGRIDTEVYNDFARLLASSSNVESADVPSAMQNLAYSIIQDMKKEDFKSMDAEDAKKWLENATTAAGYKYRQFLKRHGHRCLKEFDIHAVSWAEDPTALIKLLQNISGSCDDSKEKKEESFSKVLSQLKIPLNLKSRLLLRFILPNCRRGVREREACKSVLIKSWDNHRKGFRLLGKKMVSEGFVPDSELICFMSINDIQELLRTRNPRIITRANHRRKLFPLLDRMIFPEISQGMPYPLNMEKEEDDEKYVADLTMEGIPVSQGTVKGYCRVALTLQEAADLKQGEILITYGTDIGWSPYFPILAGVVTELGGLISHGAVISREYGLPCVVGLHGATRKFVTGDYVQLDGNKGILQRLSKPEK